MSKKTKIIIIVIVIILLLCLCSVICLAGGTYFTSGMYSKANEIKDGILLEVCESHGNMTNTEYKAWFTKDYREDVSYLGARDIVKEAFPSEYACSDLQTDNFIDMSTSGQSVSITIKNGFTVGTISFPKSTNEVDTFELVKVGDEWEIDSITVTKLSGK